MPSDTFTLYFLYGNDDLTISRRLEQIQKRVDKDGLNTTHLEAGTTTLNELNKAVNAAPFLGEKRLVFLANPSKWSSQPANREKLMNFLSSASPATMVVMHELVERKDIGKHWLLKFGEKSQIKIESYQLPKQWEMAGWIQGETKRQQGQIEAGAAERLAEYSGEDTRLAAQEITKLLTYVNHERSVRLADVDAVSVYSAEGDIFKLVDAISNGETRSAQKLLHRLLENQEAMAIWGLIIRQFRLLIQVKEILADGGSMETIQKMAGITAYETKKIIPQAKRFTMPTLEGIYHDLLDIDEGAKTGQMTIDLALDILIIKMSQR